jgi:hypothetical protein
MSLFNLFVAFALALIKKAIQKSATSVINTGVVFASTLVFVVPCEMSLFWWKVLSTMVFFFYNILAEFYFGRCFGMMLRGLYYCKPRSPLQKMCYVVFYTTSFSTMLCHYALPCGLLAVNLAVQGLFLWQKGNTWHGWLTNTETAYPEKLSGRVPC